MSFYVIQVSVKRSIAGKGKTDTCEKVAGTEACIDIGIDKIRKGKLLIVDLAGSERIDKSGKLVVHVSRVKFFQKDNVLAKG